MNCVAEKYKEFAEDRNGMFDPTFLHKVYIIINLICGKIYIGKTCKPLVRRWSEHCCMSNIMRLDTHLSRSFRKHGKENFIIKQIDSTDNPNDINKLENFWMNKLNSLDPSVGYNIIHSDENGRLMFNLSSMVKGRKVYLNNRDNCASNYYNVVKHRNKWGYYITKNYIRYGRSGFLTEMDAAQDRDLTFLYIHDKNPIIYDLLNFPENIEKYLSGEIRFILPMGCPPQPNREKQYKNIVIDNRNSLPRWYTRIIVNGRKSPQCRYKSDIEAAIAADYFLFTMGVSDEGRYNFPISNYQNSDFESPNKVFVKRSELPRYIFRGKPKKNGFSYRVCIDLRGFNRRLKTFSDLNSAIEFRNTNLLEMGKPIPADVV